MRQIAVFFLYVILHKGHGGLFQESMENSHIKLYNFDTLKFQISRKFPQISKNCFTCMTLNILNLHGYVSFFDLANPDPATRDSGNRWHSKLWPNFIIFDKGNINPQNPDPAQPKRAVSDLANPDPAISNPDYSDQDIFEPAIYDPGNLWPSPLIKRASPNFLWVSDPWPSYLKAKRPRYLWVSEPWPRYHWLCS